MTSWLVGARNAVTSATRALLVVILLPILPVDGVRAQSAQDSGRTLVAIAESLEPRSGPVRLHRRECSRLFAIGRSGCTLQPLSGFPGLLGLRVLGEDGPSAVPMVVEIRSGRAVVASSIVGWDAARRILHTFDGISLRSHSFETNVWTFVHDCMQPTSNVDGTSIYCVDYSGRLTVVDTLSDDRIEPLESRVIGQFFPDMMRERRSSIRVRVDSTGTRDRIRVTYPARYRVRALAWPVGSRTIERRPTSRTLTYERQRASRTAYTPHDDAPFEGGVESAMVDYTVVDADECSRMSRSGSPAAEFSCRRWADSNDVIRVHEYCDPGIPLSDGFVPCVQSEDLEIRSGTSGAARRLALSGDAAISFLTNDGSFLVLRDGRGLWTLDLRSDALKFVGRCWSPIAFRDRAGDEWLACVDVSGRTRVLTIDGDFASSVLVGEPLFPGGIEWSSYRGVLSRHDGRSWLAAILVRFDGNDGLEHDRDYFGESLWREPSREDAAMPLLRPTTDAPVAR